MNRPRHPSHRGSVLIVALLLSAGIAIAIGSYVNLGLSSMKLANRTFFASSCINLAEAGIEEAILAINGNDFTGWTVTGSTATTTISGMSLGQGATGQMKVVIENLSSNTPKVTCEGTSTLSDGTVIAKQIEVRLRRRSIFANGLVAKDTITFSGNNANVDSYNSNNGPYDASTNRNDNGSVGSVSVSVDAVDVDNADIWGYVATGGAQPTVGPNGSIRGDETDDDVDVDSSRIATDFTANFDPVEVPSSGFSTGSSLGSGSVGTAGTTTRLEVPSISITGSSTLTINGDVILKVTSTGNAISVGGNGQIVITAGSTLTLYVEGNCSFAGNGVTNSNTPPAAFQIYGTNSTVGGQTISFSGNADVKGVVYAPAASISITGNGETYGSFVGNSITLGGNASFHYDEALADLGSGNPFAVSLWRELTDSGDRMDMSTYF